MRRQMCFGMGVLCSGVAGGMATKPSRLLSLARPAHRFGHGFPIMLKSLDFCGMDQRWTSALHGHGRSLSRPSLGDASGCSGPPSTSRAGLCSCRNTMGNHKPGTARIIAFVWVSRRYTENSFLHCRYYSTRTTLKPCHGPADHFVGHPFRDADRHLSGVDAQLPPRSTLFSPVFGPFGSDPPCSLSPCQS